MVVAFVLVLMAVLGGCGSSLKVSTGPTGGVSSGTHSTAAAPSVTQGRCDASLWRHVYHAKRLKVIRQCTSVTGVIEHNKKEPDGDFHIRLKLDAQYTGMLLPNNYKYQQGDLVLEPVCETGDVTQQDAEAACQGFHGNVRVPPVGTHVIVTGSYVDDLEHKWAEIHPVSSVVPG